LYQLRPKAHHIFMARYLTEKEWKLIVPAPIDEVWSFFSTPQNLNRITPPEMNFEIVSGDIENMRQGMLIEYVIQPFPFLRFPWVTEITLVEEEKRFIDEQRVGPYSIWHHEHVFEECSEGVTMTDRLSYRVGFGPLAPILDRFFVSAKIESIFQFRCQEIEKIFPK
jgi:ligand-binding SRPBCC domain-containing protein